METTLTVALRWSATPSVMLPAPGLNSRRWLEPLARVQPEILDPEQPYDGSSFQRVPVVLWLPEAGLRADCMEMCRETLAEKMTTWKAVAGDAYFGSFDWKQYTPEASVQWDTSTGEVTDWNGAVLGTAGSAEECVALMRFTESQPAQMTSLRQSCTVSDWDGSKKTVYCEYFELKFSGRFGGEVEVYRLGRFPADGSWVSSLDVTGWGTTFSPGAWWYWPGEVINNV